MSVNGLTNRRAALLNGVVETITFSEPVQNISLSVLSDVVTVAYKVNGALANINDVSSNLLDPNNGIFAANISKEYLISNISVVSSANVTIQWDVRK